MVPVVRCRRWTTMKARRRNPPIRIIRAAKVEACGTCRA